MPGHVKSLPIAPRICTSRRFMAAMIGTGQCDDHNISYEESLRIETSMRRVAQPRAPVLRHAQRAQGEWSLRRPVGRPATLGSLQPPQRMNLRIAPRGCTRPRIRQAPSDRGVRHARDHCGDRGWATHLGDPRPEQCRTQLAAGNNRTRGRRVQAQRPRLDHEDAGTDLTSK